MKKSKQFTIIEMLVVLAIISLIVGMLLVGIGIARESARETRAKAEMQQIKMAVTQYLSTFKEFPFTGTSIKSDDPAWETTWAYLTGAPYKSNPTNARKQSFIKGELNQNPWGGVYNLAVDDDYTNQITGIGKNSDQDVADKVALWCLDKDGDEISTWE
ncbi:hypothetical protein LNTAR_13777 [Lentisphaera araneosa HTCC2155]|jgi:type II secretory pathway pseudopilin PulG|uniref:DUF1559 domain-containing protein n=1 Tax=Lentisphaera araneosa HTCC2155 TaxID=313628 RepID=A6DH07_9BACT|nr:type II secretion system protein [Lentisphaera araneosa]EDM28890.1 hypothetical protein LNTAR_13777 [Lentisphaera araneosa HTCC2155]